MDKKELIEKIKKEVKWYAQPRGMNQIPKSDLEAIYNQAQKLGLVKEDEIKWK